MFMDDVFETGKNVDNLRFIEDRRPHKKPYKPEDLTFATH
jgi:hypothetical protein